MTSQIPSPTRKVNPFVLLNSSQDRLDSWKNLRNHIAQLSEDDALKAVAEYWSYAPLSNISYDCENPQEWLSPWEMVSRGDWCRRMLAVAMEFTLRLSGWDPDRLTLIHLRDYSISEELLILKIDDSYALNYSVGEVVQYPDSEQIITGIWRFKNKTYVEHRH